VDPTPVSEIRKREGIIRFRVDPAEDKAIKSFATRHQITPAEVARRLVLQGIVSDGAAAIFDDRAKIDRDILVKLEEIAAVGRKRLISPIELERLIFELRRIQILILKFYSGSRE
jgi:hypothetical protein